MIKTENLTINERQFVRTYSDAGMKIEQDGTGIIYDEAVDPANIGRTYTETDEPIEGSNAEEILSIILGGAE